jgi:hypothetical protein
MRCVSTRPLPSATSRSLGALTVLTTVMTAALNSAALAVEPPDVLPLDNEIPGWVRHGDPLVAETDAELYDLIDGAATTYINHGFQSCVFQQYLGSIVGAPESLWVSVFDQTDAAGAEGVYDALGTGLETPWGGAGEDARINDTFLFVITIELWRNEFYVMIEVPKGGDPEEAVAVGQDFATVIDGYAVPVELSAFEARRDDGGVVVRWVTQCESRCFGFHLWRADAKDDYRRITEEAIPGAGTSVCPVEYSFFDDGAPRNLAVQYKLEQIDVGGTVRWYGPISVPAVVGSWGRLKAAFRAGWAP